MINLDEVARAMREEFEKYRGEKDAGKYGPLTPWDELSEQRKEKWRRMARRAAEILGVEL
jgi:hypothetical protein